MQGQSQEGSTSIARAVTWLVLKSVIVLAGLFVLVRVISPNLMTSHNDLSFWAGVALWPLALVLLVWAGVWLSADVKFIRGRLDARKRLPRVL